MAISDLLIKNKRVFIIPLDHLIEADTPHLNSIGKQNFVTSVDNLEHDGYIFHSQDYLRKPIDTCKDFFLTVGELPDNYLCNIDDLEKYPNIKNVTIYFDVEGCYDNKPYEFYKDYVGELKKRGYFVMAMGYPAQKSNDLKVYNHIVDLVCRLGCDAIKTDLAQGIDKIDLRGMYLFIAGGPYLSDKEFQKFITSTEKLKIASCSFGRNIFEAKNYKERVETVLRILNR